MSFPRRVAAASPAHVPHCRRRLARSPVARWTPGAAARPNPPHVDTEMAAPARMSTAGHACTSAVLGRVPGRTSEETLGTRPPSEHRACGEGPLPPSRAGPSPSSGAALGREQIWELEPQRLADAPASRRRPFASSPRVQLVAHVPEPGLTGEMQALRSLSRPGRPAAGHHRPPVRAGRCRPRAPPRCDPRAHRRRPPGPDS